MQSAPRYPATAIRAAAFLVWGAFFLLSPLLHPLWILLHIPVVARLALPFVLSAWLFFISLKKGAPVRKSKMPLVAAIGAVGLSILSLLVWTLAIRMFVLLLAIARDLG